MARAQASFDVEVFTRTVSLFAAKRDVFAPGAVEALAQDIVQRLAQDLPRVVVFESPDIDADQIAAFCDALIQPEPEVALRFIEDRRAEGITRQGVYLGYITAAARQLGDSWDTDRLTFAQATYGTGHLYALMRAMRAEGPAVSPTRDGKRQALFATVPGEDHGIGTTIAADMFRDLGWQIDLRTDTDHEALIGHVDRTRPQIIGLSLSGARQLDALVRLVVAMRILVPHAVIGVAPGPSLDTDRLHGLVDIDLVFRDPAAAFQDLDRLIRLRG